MLILLRESIDMTVELLIIRQPKTVTGRVSARQHPCRS